MKIENSFGKTNAPCRTQVWKYQIGETKINYWFKHLLNCNISAILVGIIKLINISKEKQIGYYLIRYIKQKIIILNWS